MRDGSFRRKKAIQFLLRHRAKAENEGYRIRELEDVGDFSFINGQWQTYMDYWSDPRWFEPRFAGSKETVGVVFKPYVKEITAVNVDDMTRPQITELLKAFGRGKYPETRFIDLLEYADAFSKRIGTFHQKLLGRKFLLEFDPASKYERVVWDFAMEALANLEPIFIFTSSASSIHTSLAEQRTVKFLLTSVTASAPESTSGNEVVLPAGNTALILDSINKILGTYAEENVFLIFDELSRFIELVGFDETYKFLLHTVDMLSSKRITALFLVNKSAREPQVVSRIRELFPNQLTYSKNGLEIVKTS